MLKGFSTQYVHTKFNVIGYKIDIISIALKSISILFEIHICSLIIHFSSPKACIEIFCMFFGYKVDHGPYITISAI